MCQRFFHTIHKPFHYLEYFFVVYSCFPGDFICNFYFSSYFICFFKGYKDAEFYPNTRKYPDKTKGISVYLILNSAAINHISGESTKSMCLMTLYIPGRLLLSRG